MKAKKAKMKTMKADWTNTDCIHLRRVTEMHDAHGFGETMESCDYDGIGGMITETCEGCHNYEPKKEEE